MLMATKLLLLLFLLTPCTFVKVINAQADSEMISMKDVCIPNVINIGSYSQLISTQGLPKSSFVSTISIVKHGRKGDGEKIAPKYDLECTYLIYDAFEYIRVGDSVQLVFVDFTKTNLPIIIKDFRLDKKTNQSAFLKIIKKRGLWTDEQSNIRIGLIESHYCSNSKVKCYGLDFNEDPYSSVVFTFHDKCINRKIWWIEFPIMRFGGIVH